MKIKVKFNKKNEKATQDNKYFNCDNCKFHNPNNDYCSKLDKVIPCGCHICNLHKEVEYK